MTLRNNIFFIAISVFTIGCAGGQLKQETYIPIEDYQGLSWDKKIEFFNSIRAATADKKNSIEKIKLPGIEIYNSAFRDPVPAVVIAAINSITGKKTIDYKPHFYALLKHKNPVVRWSVCQQLSVIPSADDLPYFSIIFSDGDWMVRECAFSQIRSYSEEKNKKSYFFTIVSHLNEKNPQTLKEIYRTLKWYNDERTFTFLYKRLFHAANSSELIIVMRELVYYNNDAVKQRLWYLSKKHPDFFVREEASKLLNSM